MKKSSLFFGGIWILILAACFSTLLKYAGTPGRGVSKLNNYWPAKSMIVRHTNKAQLLVFAHPYCPCSKASLGELEKLLPDLQGKVDVTVIFVQPKNREISWVHSPLWDFAKKLPGVNVINDPDYKETDLFGAMTSGHSLLFDKKGYNIYSGGLTPARGHMGDSLGKDLLMSSVNGNQAKRTVASVFGCSLKELN